MCLCFGRPEVLEIGVISTVVGDPFRKQFMKS